MNCNLSICIPTDKVGLLIGKSGNHFLTIAKLSKVKLQLQNICDLPRGSRERGVVFCGTPSACVKATEIVINKLCDAHETQEVEILKWVIPQGLCGVLIGAWVKIAHLEETFSGNKERIVYIRGTHAATQLALEKVKQLVGGHAIEEDIISNQLKNCRPNTSSSSGTNPPTHGHLDMTIPLSLLQTAIDICHHADSTIHLEIDPSYQIVIIGDVPVRLSCDNTLTLDQGRLKIVSVIEEWKLTAEKISPTPQQRVVVKFLVQRHDSHLVDQIHANTGVSVFCQPTAKCISMSSSTVCWALVMDRRVVYTAFHAVLSELHAHHTGLEVSLPMQFSAESTNQNANVATKANNYERQPVYAASFAQLPNNLYQQSFGHNQSTPVYYVPVDISQIQYIWPNQSYYAPLVGGDFYTV